MNIGNVIKSPDGHLWIVSHVDDETVTAVSFTAENFLAISKLADHTRLQICVCACGVDEYGVCELCHGNGHFQLPVKGWQHSEVLATNAREFMLATVAHVTGMKVPR